MAAWLIEVQAVQVALFALVRTCAVIIVPLGVLAFMASPLQVADDPALNVRRMLPLASYPRLWLKAKVSALPTVSASLLIPRFQLPAVSQVLVPAGLTVAVPRAVIAMGAPPAVLTEALAAVGAATMLLVSRA